MTPPSLKGAQNLVTEAVSKAVGKAQCYILGPVFRWEDEGFLEEVMCNLSLKCGGEVNGLISFKLHNSPARSMVSPVCSRGNQGSGKKK